MKKKKEIFSYKPIEISTNSIIFIILGILVILIAGFSFGWEKIAPWLSQDEFTIYKEECWNETDFRYWHLTSEPINLTVKKSELIFLNRELLFYRFLEKAKKEQNFTEGFIGCREDRNDFMVIEEDENKVVYGLESSIYGYGLRVDDCHKTNVEKCTSEKVDEIVIENYIGEGGAYCYNVEDCRYEELGNNRRKIYEIIKISKSDLTIEWLEENCECIGGCEYECLQEYKIHKNIDKLNNCIHERNCPKTPQSVCSEYKCDSYTIEVK